MFYKNRNALHYLFTDIKENIYINVCLFKYEKQQLCNK